MRAKKAQTKDSLLFKFSMENYRKKFSAASLRLGLGSLRLYQLRHGGATEDLCSQKRDYSAVKARGRWRSDASVRRYAKVGKVQELLNRLSPGHLKFLPMGREEHEQGVPRFPSSKDASLDVSNVDVLNMKGRPRRFCLEIFAGTARISSGLQKAGLPTFPIDIDLFPSHDVLDPTCAHTLLNWISGGRVIWVWLGMPCTTFTGTTR